MSEEAKEGAPAKTGGGAGVLAIVCDWRIYETGGRRFGSVSIDVPPPLSQLSLERAFTLPEPTSARCALFAVVVGTEIAVGAAAEGMLGGATPAIVTKSRAVRDAIASEPGASASRAWAADPSARRPARILGHSKQFVAAAFRLIDELREAAGGDVIYVEPDESDSKSGGLLGRSVVNLDVDVEKDLDRTGDDEECKRRLDEMRERAFMRQKLLSMAGARGSRPARTATNAERAATAAGDATSKKKKKKKQKKLTVVPKSADGDGNRNAAAAADDAAAGSAGAIAAAVAAGGNAIDGRGTAAASSLPPPGVSHAAGLAQGDGGGGREEARDAPGDVPAQELRAPRGEQPPAD